MRFFRFALLALVVAALTSVTRAQQADPLAASFTSPPDSAKPHTWWHWMNGNVSKAGITADLEAMKRVGIGGAHLAQVGTGIPKGPVPYDSPEMVDCVQFAFKEADRLGLDLCLFNCPGWSSSGGPWIKPENSMKVLVYTEATAVGGQHVAMDLPQPTATQNFYRDAVWLAYRTPAADSRLPNFNNGRGNARGGPATPAAARGAGPASAPATPESSIDPAQVLDLSKAMNDKGHLEFDPPAGNWTILRLGFTTNGTQNHPGPDGGVGLEVDKFSKEALDVHFNAFFNKYFDVMKPLTAKGKMAALIDSYETGLQNWTDKFPEEFKKRRGYDIAPYMPTMMLGRIVGSPDISQRFLWDVRKTQGELMNENYYGHFTELCHQHGMLAYTEPYDNGNFDEMIAGSYADMPMAEFWQGQANQRSIKLVASVMHMNGKPIMGAESFTSQSRWTESPYSLKALGDFMWTQGLNKFVFHRFAMQPNADPTVFPGMTMGPWGGHFDRTNTWFEPGKAWMQYIARSQFLLQQGLFVGDLAYFAGEDSPVRNPDESKLNPAPPSGYGYDTIDTQTMKNRVKIVDGKITLPDGLAYRVFVLPPTIRTMSAETMQNIHDLVSAGMTLVASGPMPQKTPSLMGYPNADTIVATLAADLWADMNGTTITDHACGKGHVYWGVPLADVLKTKLNAKPDFEFTSASGTADINYIHRHLTPTAQANIDGTGVLTGITITGVQRDIYFVANRGAQAEALLCTFNVSGEIPEFWDSVTGTRIPATLYDNTDGRTRVALQLEPSGSIFVVFHANPNAIQITLNAPPPPPPQLPPHITAISKDGKVLASSDVLSPNKPPATPMGIFPRGAQRPLALPQEPSQNPVELAAAMTPLAWENGAYTFHISDGTEKSATIAALPAPAELTGPWHLAFPPKLGAPPEATFDKLISWSDSPDAGIKYFSGTATYSRKLTVTADQLAAPRRLFLDLGRVQVLAQVTLNGKDLGTLWTFPFRTDITDAAHAGDNDLEIRVTNLWPNRLIGDENLPAENQYFGTGGRGANGARGTASAIIQMPDWYTQGLGKPDGGRITFTTWHHWSATDPLLESGLIGPVVLRTAVPLIAK